MKYYNFLTKSIMEHKQRVLHYEGNLISRQRLPLPRFLIIEQKPEGVFLNRYTEQGIIAGDTWHQTVGEAKKQARYEYMNNLQEWKKISDEIGDPVEYLLHRLKNRL